VPTAAAPGIQIEDADSPMMAGAEARLSEGMCVGDELHLNGVTVNEDGTIGDTGVKMEVVQDDTGYAIRFSGEADQATYTDLLSRVKLQNSGTEPDLGDRFIDFTVDDGQASTTARATVRVTDEPNPSDIILDPATEDPGAEAMGAEAPAEKAEGLAPEAAGLTAAMAPPDALAEAGADDTQGPDKGDGQGDGYGDSEAEGGDGQTEGGTKADAPTKEPEADNENDGIELSASDATLESTVLFDLEEPEDTDDGGGAWTDDESDAEVGGDGGWTDTVEGGGDANADPPPDFSNAGYAETGSGMGEDEVFGAEEFV